jgi:chemotaxis protein CheC
LKGTGNSGSAELDLLKELANIGVGNAVTALSVMLNDQKVTMCVPQVEVAPLQDVPESFGHPEEMVTVTYCEAGCSLFSLVLLFVLPLKAAEKIVARLLPGSTLAMDEMARSLLVELGNIMTGSYLSALSSITALTFNASPPRLGIDMAGAILGTVIAETNILDDSLIILHTTIEVEGEDIEGSVLIWPYRASLDRLLQHLGGS